MSDSHRKYLDDQNLILRTMDASTTALGGTYIPDVSDQEMTMRLRSVPQYESGGDPA